ncbi:cbb3-type cytochrome oxidase assembly protein CcoS [Aureibacter tunicatorum]|uniref:Cbb3-type cytochrome oxidase maturation protein n=1 Tax=Aureibacter tunicatorum TaxID=866807 RepID=A0AAE3XI58_9BACT|nr:cbb3-type cytochrome oxidase assembly protein CcoS [Aureibacter tunicatorum]MDR6237242.1 cbb3-type cytochrome oxidase maturation protein [Aureibacter tunicatorum]BDD06234.1 cytochrome oxidase maturation protein Cbb3 [Aureibacter tunicatorum]
MSVIFILIIFSVTVAIGFLIAFFWAVRSGQYEDTYSPSVRILFDDKVKKSAKKDQIEEKLEKKKS